MKRMFLPGLAAVAAATLVLAGCGPDRDYGDGARFAERTLTERTRWSASGTLRNPSAAIDGNVATAAVSASSYSNAALTIDLGGVCVFNMIVMDHGESPDGYCRQVALLTSMDGRDFTRIATISGTRRITSHCLIAPQLARYVRIQAVMQGDRPWSIAEVYLQ